MKLPDPILTLTHEVMEAYLTGQLTNAQRHQVEKLLLEDDFASEAMEGMETMEPAERHESIDRLNTRVSARIKPKRKSSTVMWYAVAASFVILIAATYLLIRDPEAGDIQIAQESTPLEESIAQAEADEENTIPQDEPSGERSGNLNERASEESDNIAMVEIPDEEIVEELEAVESNETFQDSLSLTMSDVSPERIAQIDEVELDTRAKEEAIPAAVNDLDKTRATAGRITGEPLRLDVKRLSGQVVLQDGMPVSNASVLISGTTNRVQTDNEGYFEIDTDADDKLVLSMMGLESKEVSAEELRTSGAMNSIVMDQSSPTLSELVVSAAPADRVSTRGARPQMTDAEFLTYLEDNLKLPDVEEPLSGTVVIRVTIEADGTISNTKILRSLGEPYDIEAIRLIREGPEWEPAVKKGIPVKDKVRVRIVVDSE